MRNDLLKKLEKTRQLMIKSGVENGLQNPETIRLSKKLDRLMNEFEVKSDPLESTGEYKYIQ